MQEVVRQNAGGDTTKQRPSSLPWSEGLEGLTLDTPVVVAKEKPKKTRGLFVKGPIPYEWVKNACKAGAGDLAWYLWHKKGILGDNASIQIRPAELKTLGLGDRKRQRQTDKLENAGLVSVERGPGKCPKIKLMFIN